MSIDETFHANQRDSVILQSSIFPQQLAEGWVACSVKRISCHKQFSPGFAQ